MDDRGEDWMMQPQDAKNWNSGIPDHTWHSFAVFKNCLYSNKNTVL
jgi:hypothetical protein